MHPQNTSATAPTIPTVITLDVTDDASAAQSVRQLDDRARTLLRQALKTYAAVDTETAILDIVRTTLAQQKPDENLVGVVFTASDYDEGYFISHVGGATIYPDGDLGYLFDVDFPDELRARFAELPQVAPDSMLLVSLRHNKIYLTRDTTAATLGTQLAESNTDPDTIKPWE
jgi:hypothetical protein